MRPPRLSANTLLVAVHAEGTMPLSARLAEQTCKKDQRGTVGVANLGGDGEGRPDGAAPGQPRRRRKVFLNARKMLS